MSATDGLTYSPPCTGCGDSDHDRTECAYAPTVRGFEERSTPMATGWRWVNVYPDGNVTEWELITDPYNGHRLAAYGHRSTDADGNLRPWANGRWRGRQPVGGLKGA